MRPAQDSPRKPARGPALRLAALAVLACVVLSGVAVVFAISDWSLATRDRVAQRLGWLAPATDTAAGQEWTPHAPAGELKDQPAMTIDQQSGPSLPRKDQQSPATTSDATSAKPPATKAAAAKEDGSAKTAAPTKKKDIEQPTPPLPDDQALKVVGQGGLAYQWTTGYDYGCRYDLQADHGEITRVASGMVTYRPTNVDPASVRTTGEGERRDSKDATGTAFVVHPDGALVTCAHVVRGATEIQVHLNGQVLKGRVVALDKSKDLAVVRVTAKALPFVRLGNSDELQLAQEIRVIGYPLSDVLGESVKVSRGEISGLIKPEHGERLLQIDATVNPGNSGGPIVDETGAVVGVASALITGERIAAIGFGVPVNDARALLEQRGIKLPRVERAPSSSGTEIVKRVSPAVAFIKVKLGPGGVGGEEQKVIDFQAVFSSHLTRGGGLFARTDGLTTKTDQGRLVVNDHGEVAHHQGLVDLPYLLGPLGQLGIEPLSGDGGSTWSSRALIVLREVKTEQRAMDDFPYFGTRPPPKKSRTPPGGRPDPFGRRTETTETSVLHPAVEQTTYKIAKTEGDAIHIEKTWEIKSLDGKDEPPYIHAAGKGTLVFDKRLGLPRTADLKAKFRVRGDPQVALTMSLAFTKPEETASRSKKAKEAGDETGGAKAVAENPVRKLNSPGGAAAALPPTGGSGGLSQFDPDGAAKTGAVPASPKAKPPAAKETPPEEVPSGSGLDKFNPDSPTEKTGSAPPASKKPAPAKEQAPEPVPGASGLDKFNPDK